ncbi:MAG TPA: outer membrane lipoprotein-sorting protein [Rectinemataceae bacterium]|nr:outer membrane lipoprotein-sorting protein [Rectinemataceae bacterium]
MKHRQRTILALVLAASAAAAFAAPDFKAELKAVDELSDFGKQDYTAVYGIVTEKPGDNPTTMQIKIFRRDAHDQIVILFQKPEKQKGQGYLKIDDNVWFYDPESGAYSHSTMKENISNTKAKNSDFKKYTYAEDFDVVKAESGRLGIFDTWVLTLQAKNDEVSYQKIKLTIRKDKPIPLMEEDYSVSNRLMRTIYFLPTYIEVAGRLVPARIKMVDNINVGEQSVLTLSDVHVGRLPDMVFSKTFLEQAQ